MVDFADPVTYGVNDKATFVLCSDKFGFALMPCLVIDLKSVIIV